MSLCGLQGPVLVLRGPLTDINKFKSATTLFFHDPQHQELKDHTFRPDIILSILGELYALHKKGSKKLSK